MHHIYTIRVPEVSRQSEQKKIFEGIRMKTFQNILSKKSAYMKSLMNSKKDKYRDPQMLHHKYTESKRQGETLEISWR